MNDLAIAIEAPTPMLRTNLTGCKISSGGLTFIMHAECIGGVPALTAYQDSKGIWTIGVGHIKGVSHGMTCTMAQAMAWLDEDLDEAESAVCRLVTVPLTTNQFDALVSLVFNIGTEAFAKSTLLRKLNAGDFQGASAQFSVWNKITLNGVLVVSNGLSNRRGLESALFNTPDAAEPNVGLPSMVDPASPVAVVPTMPVVSIGTVPMANEQPVAPKQTVMAQPGGKSGVAALLTGGAGAIASGYQQVTPVISAVRRIVDDTAGMGSYLRVFAVVLAIGSIGFMGWSLWNQHKAVKGV